MTTRRNVSFTEQSPNAAVNDLRERYTEAAFQSVRVMKSQRMGEEIAYMPRVTGGGTCHPVGTRTQYVPNTWRLSILREHFLRMNWRYAYPSSHFLHAPKQHSLIMNAPCDAHTKDLLLGRRRHQFKQLFERTRGGTFITNASMQQLQELVANTSSNVDDFYAMSCVTEHRHAALCAALKLCASISTVLDSHLRLKIEAQTEIKDHELVFENQMFQAAATDLFVVFAM